MPSPSRPPTPPGLPPSASCCCADATPRGSCSSRTRKVARAGRRSRDAAPLSASTGPTRRRKCASNGRVESVTEAEADAYFAARARDSQIGAWASDQSRPLASRFALLRRFVDFRRRSPGPRPASAALVRISGGARVDRNLVRSPAPTPRPPSLRARGRRVAPYAPESLIRRSAGGVRASTANRGRTLRARFPRRRNAFSAKIEMRRRLSSTSESCSPVAITQFDARKPRDRTPRPCSG
jgi:hypothetical protein